MEQVLQIIRKSSTERTPHDYKVAYRILFQDKSISRYVKFHEIVDFDKLLDNLRFLSKSRLQKFLYCPFQLKMQYIMNHNAYREQQITIDGKNLHWVNEMLWNERITVDEILDATKIYNLIFDKYVAIIPEPYDDLSDFVKEMIANFCWFETQRINGIFKVTGKTKDAVQNYVFPIAHELGIENHGKYLDGFIDRIERATNEGIIYTDYKYGKAKYFDGSPFDKRYMTTEIGFYAILPQGKEVYVVVGKDEQAELIPIKEYFNELGISNPVPYYGSVVYFQDIKETSRLFKVSKKMMTIVEKQIENYWNCIDTGRFKVIPRNACFEWCGHYWDVCEVNPEWIEVENAV